MVWPWPSKFPVKVLLTPIGWNPAPLFQVDVMPASMSRPSA